jgi:hypothetical protein
VYGAIQASLILAYLLGAPGRWGIGLEVAVGWLGAASVLAGAALQRLPGLAIWTLFAAGIFFNSSGLVVEQVLSELSMPTAPGNPADLFFLAYFPCFISGLGILVYRRAGNEDQEGIGVVLGTAISTVVTAAMGVIAWETIISPMMEGREASLLNRVVVTAYPLGDLVVLALMLRLLLTGGLLNGAFLLMLGSILAFLAADIGWAALNGTPSSDLTGRMLHTLSLVAFALPGAAVWRPGIRAVTELALPERVRTGPAIWGSLVVSVLTAPMVLLVEALFDRLFGTTLR